MFERFTEQARSVVVGAQEQARTLRHHEIVAEHLLLAVLTEEGTAWSDVLRDCGVERAALVGELATLGDADAHALRALGVDLDAVRRQAEAAFGAGALDRPRRRRTGFFRRQMVWTGGHLRFTDSAKQALEQSLRQALALHHRHIGVEHVLLGLLADDQTSASRTLRRLGVDPTTVRDGVRRELDRAA